MYSMSASVVGARRPKKFKINEIACKLFLERFCQKNMLAQSDKIEKIAHELRYSVALDYDAIQIIIKSLRRVITCLKSEFNTFQDVYSDLMHALSNSNIFVGNISQTPCLRLLYRSIFDNDLDLITDIAHRCDIASWYGSDENQCPDTACNDRFRQMLGEKTLGIFDEDGRTISYYGLSHPESNVNRLFNGVLGINYAPQLYNNIPYVYGADQGDSRRLRISTQTQQFLGGSCIPSTFKKFLRSIDLGHGNDASNSNYLYINLQKTSKKDSYNGLVRYFESSRTDVLHDELRNIPGVTVITLPADSSTFFKGFDLHQGKALLHYDDKNNFESLGGFFEEVYSCILNDRDDFVIPIEVKRKIFGNYDLEMSIRKHLVDLFHAAAIEILGTAAANEHTMISMEQRQAIYFHFVKHKLTRFIVSKLKPKFFNISCKDAIDRAGVHNLWNILCGRIESDTAMTLLEFETILNIPAILVKDRPINDHVNALANVLGHYYYHLSSNKKNLIPWAATWLKNNTIFKSKAADAFTWSYAIGKSNRDYHIAHGIYNELYIAVSSGEFLEIDKILNSNAPVDIYDNSSLRNDSVLICAAKKGHFEIFVYLLQAHARFEKTSKYFSINPLHGLRGWHPVNMGTALNYLLEHIEIQDVDVENDSYEVDIIEKCIWAYLESIFTTKSVVSRAVSLVRSESFSYYTGQVDESGLTPIMHLARTGNHLMLNKIARICEKNNYHISQVFDLKNTAMPNTTVLQYAAEYRHQNFIDALFELTKFDEIYSSSEYRQARYNASSRVMSQLFY